MAMNIKKGQVLQLKIEKMAFGGPGIGFVDGFVVFVPASAPGDKLRVKVFKKKKDYAEARILEILEPSDARISPPCPYYPHCGGCQWQHIAYTYQLQYKEGLVREAIANIGGLGDAAVKQIIPSELITGYRNKMEFSFSSRRWALPQEMPLSEDEKTFVLGLHVPGTFNKVLDISQCLLQPKTANQILRAVRDEAKQSGLPAYDIKSHQGFWRYLTIRHSVAFDEWMVNIVSSGENPSIKTMAARLTESVANIKSIVNNISQKRAGVAIGDYEKLVYGQPWIREKIGPYVFQVSANSFFQTNTRGAKKLYDVVADYARLTGKEMVLDLYSGTGTIALYLAAKAARVLGVELNAAAVSDALKNRDLNKVDNASFIQGDIRDQLPLLKEVPDVLIIDPPRSGMHKDAAKQISELGADTLVYVSCNPVTMARDLAMLNEYYELVEIQPVDMFPNTHHVEAVGLLKPKGSRMMVNVS